MEFTVSSLAFPWALTVNALHLEVDCTVHVLRIRHTKVEFNVVHEDISLIVIDS